MQALLLQNPTSAQDSSLGIVQGEELIPFSSKKQILFDHLPPDPDAETGRFLNSEEVRKLFKGALLDEAGYIYDQNYLIFYREDGFAYAVRKGGFLDGDTNYGQGAGKWYTKGEYVCIDWIVGNLLCDRVKLTVGGKLVKFGVRGSKPTERPTYLIIPRFTRAIRLIESEAISKSEQIQEWRDTMASIARRMLSPQPNSCNRLFRGETISVPC